MPQSSFRPFQAQVDHPSIPFHQVFSIVKKMYKALGCHCCGSPYHGHRLIALALYKKGCHFLHYLYPENDWRWSVGCHFLVTQETNFSSENGNFVACGI